MAIVKRISDHYTLKSINSTSNVTLDTSEVKITGNLVVLGAYATITTTDTIIKDNKIVLNAGETGAGVTAGTAGIEIARGSAANVSILYDEAIDKWKVTDNGTTFANLVASTTGLTRLVDDTNPTLGANLNLNTYTIYANVGNNKIAGNIQINNTTATPSSVTNATVLYASTPGQGTSGIYVVNQAATSEELITKTRALGFSLLL